MIQLPNPRTALSPSVNYDRGRLKALLLRNVKSVPFKECQKRCLKGILKVLLLRKIKGVAFNPLTAVGALKALIDFTLQWGTPWQ